MAVRTWLALALLAASGARAEIYRCEDADGAIRFTGDPSQCRRPVVHTPDASGLSLDPPAGPDEAEASEPTDADGGPAPPLSSQALQALLPAAGRSWEAVDEPPESARDPQLVAQGLRASVARHYTRARGPVSEVCTVEVWSFERASQARAVQSALGEPLWWKGTAGALLVLAHGVRLEREVGTRHGLVPGCQALAEGARARAAGVR